MYSPTRYSWRHQENWATMYVVAMFDWLGLAFLLLPHGKSALFGVFSVE